MTKISETIHYDEGEDRIVVQQQHDFTPVVDQAKALKSAGMDTFGESKLVGVVPMKMWHEWAKKWGVSPGDTNAMREVVARELNSSDNAHLRVWEGEILMGDDQRLERIEKKLDTLSDAVVSLARMEERMITLFKRMDGYDENQREMGKRVGSLEKSTSTNGQMLRFAERLFWIIASSVVAYFALKLRGE